MDKRLIQLAKQIKNNIQKLINENKIDEAEKLINNYCAINNDDIEIYSIKSIIYIMKNELDEAKIILKKGIEIDENNFELNYNLAYLYEAEKDEELSNFYYQRAYSNCEDDEMKKNIRKHVKTVEKKKKIAFFVKPGMDSFLDDIINNLTNDYETKKIIVTEYKQIDDGMEWADFCWFEWCDELLIYGSKQLLATKRKIICRLHSYEAFTNYIQEVNWNTVDKLIFVAKHIKKNVLNKIKFAEDKTCVIPNGVKLQKYNFKERKKGKNIAYVGYINYKKGPMLLIHAFKAIYDYDNSYKLYIAGKFQDERDVLYFNQMIKEFGLEENIIYEGWQDNLDLWLENKNYIICTSILESQNMSVMQAMAKGIKPLVHNFVGAKAIYNTRYVWSSIDELVEKVDAGDYNSKEYREFIKREYSFDEEIKKIENVFISDRKHNESIYPIIYNGQKINFYLPYPNDFIEKVIYSTNNFYEVQMLEDVKKRIGKNKVIIDVGANIGNHTVFFANVCKAKRLYSFEPQPDVFEILKKNVYINRFYKNVKLFNMGLGESAGYANIDVINKDNLGMSRLNKDNHGSVEINRLDDIISSIEKNKIDMIKIDVEGMGLEVLKGSRKVLKKDKPIIYIEAESEEEFNVITNFLVEFNYRPIMRFNATPTYLFV